MVETVKQKPFRVLTLDGGGIRGLYTATLLDILHSYFSDDRADKFGESFGQKFDLIAGTSTGGILALGLAAGVSLKDIRTLYKEHGAEIFPPENCIPNASRRMLLWGPRFLGKPSSNYDALKRCLTDVFGDSTLEQIYEKHKVALCIPTVDASTWRAAVIKTPHKDHIKRDGKRRAVDVCLATSAAPVFFPMAALPRTEADGHDVFVDGGLWANNPVLVGLIEAIDLAAEGQPIEIISVGTCPVTKGKTLTPNDCSRGWMAWAKGAEALSLSLEAQASGHAYMARKLVNFLNPNYKVIRLPSGPISERDLPHIGIDRAYKTALSILESYAVRDAKEIESKCNNGDMDMRLVKDIFSSRRNLNESNI